MVIIKAACPECGEVELMAEDLHLQTYVPLSERDWYEFTCPNCEVCICKPADANVVQLLRSGKVPETRVFLPIEALDPKRAVTTALTRDDLIDLLAALDAFDGSKLEF